MGELWGREMRSMNAFQRVRRETIIFTVLNKIKERLSKVVINIKANETRVAFGERFRERYRNERLGGTF